MRIHSALVLCLLLGCAGHPAPDGETLDKAVKQPYGGYIVVTLRDGTVRKGELLAIDRNALWVLDRRHQTHSFELRAISRADLYKYDHEGFGWWGGLGSLSTLSHGALLLISLPVWAIATMIVSSAESTHAHLSYPDDEIKELSMWARYPQGMPSPPPTTSREQAWELTKQAQIAARAGRCDEVASLDARVQQLDKDFYDVTFLRDEAIRRCLQLPSLLPHGSDAGVP